MPNVATPSEIDNEQKQIDRLSLLCWAVALRWQLDELSLQQAVDQALVYALNSNLDTDIAQRIMGTAFARVRDDLGPP